VIKTKKLLNSKTYVQQIYLNLIFACDITDIDLMIQQIHCRERLKLRIYNVILT